jgi:hypothetical protein
LIRADPKRYREQRGSSSSRSAPARPALTPRGISCLHRAGVVRALARS